MSDVPPLRVEEDIARLQGVWRDGQGNTWTVEGRFCTVATAEGPRQEHVLGIASGRPRLLGTAVERVGGGCVVWGDGDRWERAPARAAPGSAACTRRSSPKRRRRRLSPAAAARQPAMRFTAGQKALVRALKEEVNVLKETVATQGAIVAQLNTELAMLHGHPRAPNGASPRASGSPPPPPAAVHPIQQRAPAEQSRRPALGTETEVTSRGCSAPQVVAEPPMRVSVPASGDSAGTTIPATPWDGSATSAGTQELEESIVDGLRRMASGTPAGPLSTSIAAASVRAPSVSPSPQRSPSPPGRAPRRASPDHGMRAGGTPGLVPARQGSPSPEDPVESLEGSVRGILAGASQLGVSAHSLRASVTPAPSLYQPAFGAVDASDDEGVMLVHSVNIPRTTRLPANLPTTPTLYVCPATGHAVLPHTALPSLPTMIVVPPSNEASRETAAGADLQGADPYQRKAGRSSGPVSDSASSVSEGWGSAVSGSRRASKIPPKRFAGAAPLADPSVVSLSSGSTPTGYSSYHSAVKSAPRARSVQGPSRLPRSLPWPDNVDPLTPSTTPISIHDGEPSGPRPSKLPPPSYSLRGDQPPAHTPEAPSFLR